MERREDKKKFIGRSAYYLYWSALFTVINCLSGIPLVLTLMKVVPALWFVYSGYLTFFTIVLTGMMQTLSLPENPRNVPK